MWPDGQNGNQSSPTGRIDFCMWPDGQNGNQSSPTGRIDFCSPGRSAHAHPGAPATLERCLGVVISEGPGGRVPLKPTPTLERRPPWSGPGGL